MLYYFGVQAVTRGGANEQLLQEVWIYGSVLLQHSRRGICIQRGSRDKIRDSGLTHDRWNGEILRKFWTKCFSWRFDSGLSFLEKIRSNCSIQNVAFRPLTCYFTGHKNIPLEIKRRNFFSYWKHRKAKGQYRGNFTRIKRQRNEKGNPEETFSRMKDRGRRKKRNIRNGCYNIPRFPFRRLSFRTARGNRRRVWIIKFRISILQN